MNYSRATTLLPLPITARHVTNCSTNLYQKLCSSHNSFVHTYVGLLARKSKSLNFDKLKDNENWGSKTSNPIAIIFFYIKKPLARIEYIITSLISIVLCILQFCLLGNWHPPKMFFQRICLFFVLMVLGLSLQLVEIG